MIPGLDFKEPLAVAAGQAGIVAGVLPDADRPVAAARALRLRARHAARHRRPRQARRRSKRCATGTCGRTGSTGPLTLYVVPLREGAAAVACYGPATGCDQTAASLKLEGHEALPVGPSAAFAEDVEALADDLQAARTDCREGARPGTHPRRAGRRAAQARSAYRSAAETELEPGPAEREIVRGILASVTDAAGAYIAAARAARARAGARATTPRAPARAVRKPRCRARSAGSRTPATASAEGCVATTPWGPRAPVWPAI